MFIKLFSVTIVVQSKFHDNYGFQEINIMAYQFQVN